MKQKRLWQAPELAELNRSLQELGLAGAVAARQIDNTQVAIQVARLIGGKNGKTTDTVSIADVCFGVSQTLPVLVALLVARPGQLVYIEQPKIHLHPRAQTALAPILARAAERGVRVVVETHSALLLRHQNVGRQGRACTRPRQAALVSPVAERCNNGYQR